MASRDIKDCIPELQLAWPVLKELFEKKFPGWKIVLTSTHRPPEEQFKIFKEGRKLNDETGIWEVVNKAEIKTNRDGYKKLSLHNDFPAKAFDVAILNPKGKTVWPDPTQPFPPQWASLLDLATKTKLECGGSWTKLIDWPHFQLPIKTT